MRKTIHTPEARHIAAMLRDARIAKELTMRELAALLDCPHTLIAKIESGERRVDLVELETICDTLGVDLLGFVRRYRQRPPA